MSFYPKDLKEEALKQRVANDFFAKFSYEPLERVDFALKNKGEALDIIYLLWAEAKKGNEASVDESLVQLILTIGTQKLHKSYNTPEFLGAFDCEKIVFLPYKFIKDFLYRADFDWTTITPTKYQSEPFQRMLSLTKDIFTKHNLAFDFEKDNKELKEFIKNSLAKGKHNPIEIDADNFNEVYLKWCNKVLPTINLQNEMWKKARKQNIALEQDFFLADLISQNNVSLKENLRILLQKRQDDELYYKVKTKKNDLFQGQFDNLEIEFIDKNAHNNFWENYTRPPKEQFWSKILERRDKLTPQDIMERKGAFYTPKIWVQKAQDYLKSVLGKGWQDEYYIWDCAAGTGNLLKGLTNSAHIYASTLDLSDVLIMKELCKIDKNDKTKTPEQRLNLLDKNIFAFDFLNDDFSILPQTLQEILKDEKKREKLIIFINPPYAEASSSKTINDTQSKHKTGVSSNRINKIDYFTLLGRGANELFAQFFMRIYKEIPNCILASFSTLKYINSQNFAKFRDIFKAEFKKGFCVPADTFDNVKGQFPIGFLIWDTSEKKEIKEIRLDIYEIQGSESHKETVKIKDRPKTLYAIEKNKVILNWLQQYYDQQGENSKDRLAYLVRGASDFSNNQIIFIDNQPSQAVIKHSQTNDITAKNLIPNCIFFAIRKSIEHTWLNHNDQFLYPNDKWQEDSEFQNDCLAFTLFHGQNRISCHTERSEVSQKNHKEIFRSAQNDKNDKSINHFIPFNASEVADGSFLSDFMYKFINGKFGDYTCHTELSQESEVSIKSKCGYFANAQYDKKNKAQNDGILPFDKKEINLPTKKSFIPDKPLQFSKEAKAVFDAGREIWRYYHQNARQNDYKENASLYDIKEHFQGRNEKGRMNTRSDDETYNGLMATLRLALKDLATKITPKIYEYGFLRE